MSCESPLPEALGKIPGTSVQAFIDLRTLPAVNPGDHHGSFGFYRDRFAAFAPSFPKAVRVDLGRWAIVRLRFAAAAAFLMLRFAAVFCLLLLMMVSVSLEILHSSFVSLSLLPAGKCA
jgi:hypothetical protein